MTPRPASSGHAALAPAIGMPVVDTRTVPGRERVSILLQPPHVRIAVEARKGASAALRDRLAAFARRAGGASPGAVEVLGAGPGRWHVVLSGADRGRDADRLREAVGPDGAFLDVTDGFAVIRLDGPESRPALRKLIRLDVAALAEGTAAQTELHGMSVQVRRTPSGGLELAVSRSYGESLLEAVVHAAAEFGVSVAAA
ncbi:hypothetical protein [Chthonobacter rhizosphaerae]|uniref:hypothetical protein n=1 Tax=Chthonobacter rhizosphaerae TaxID=2735553 RepID=UPI0015EF89C7|nr:hypothetical protein [Chthonobacter rhizosphaerae]